MCTPPPSLLCIDISPGTPCHTYAQAAEAILRASSSTDYTWQTVYVSSDIMENPSRRDFAAIIDAVLACPGVEVFAIFCWTIPPLGCTDIKRLATAHPDIRRQAPPPPGARTRIRSP